MKRKNETERERQEKRILTNETWFPTREDGTVKATFVALMTGARVDAWRVCVWGEDDFGMERDFKDRMEALAMFRRVVDLTTQAQLMSWGFVRA